MSEGEMVAVSAAAGGVGGIAVQPLRRDLEAFRINAFIDLHGPYCLDLAIELGVPTARINTITKCSARRKGRTRPHRRDGAGFAPAPT
ncbi:hypothetical protein AB5J56_24550 [Streptomyces sp. R21]|uniref:Uncharacterized protein n=1 Tax=Streptomyces sp. R21 TaxID=3238627 RepID=A0AB39PB40_9ACTN